MIFLFSSYFYANILSERNQIIKKLGNMSNPSINRWGLNLFWYRFWYNDKINALTINQDNLINRLILLYTHFGLLHPKNLFFNKYWFFSSDIPSLSSQNEYNLKYFRLIEYKNKVLNEYKSYKIRNKIKNLYYSKIWILRYQKWIIVNFYCFQPLTSKTLKKKLRKKSLDFYLNESKNNPLLTRYRFFLFYFFNLSLKNKNYYKF